MLPGGDKQTAPAVRATKARAAAKNEDRSSSPRLAAIPETTSVEGLERYVGGKCLAFGRGEAWRDVKAWFLALPPLSDAVRLPSVSEPFLAWTTSGEVDFQEREIGGPWITHRIREGSFFLTFGGAPYDVRWKAVTPEPFQAMFVFVGLPLIHRACAEVFGADATFAQLQDVSAFGDSVLGPLVDRLRGELTRDQASPLFVQGIGQAIAVHLVRNYAVLTREPRSGSPSLPAYKLRRVTGWMAEHVADELNLDRLAAQVGLSKFYFHRLFKRAMGVSPSRYHIMLRMDEARRLLRETRKGVVDIALEVGYASASHFAHLFRRETGLSPSDYRRQR